MIGAFITIAFILIVVAVGFWVFESDDSDHDEWKGW